MPPAEAALWNALRALKSTGLHFRRQVPLGRYYADFASHHPRIVIEVDGWTHSSPAYDAERNAFMQAEGYRASGHQWGRAAQSRRCGAVDTERQRPGASL